MKELSQSEISHMSMIQGVITRLETNCFTLKALAMTIAAAVLAFTGTTHKPSWIYPIAGVLPIIIFWIMDAQYLRLGRLFRQLYNAVRNGEIDEPFTMNIKPYMKDEQCVICIAASWSICWYYLSILVTFVIISLYYYTKGG